ncbi:MAG: tRNA (guanosine(37)-N1)-methyltransferase TrmD, partial [Clostridia bacterium]|nr:tRNA (guanosine(37)-N1)-methyltransferase TrmD [Clostridia bacterium]
ALVDTVLHESIIGRACAAGHIEIYTHNIRDWSADKWRRVDGTPAGGGKGMLIAAPPVYNCYKGILDIQSDQPDHKRRVIYMSPQGALFTQEKAKELLQYDNLILLCGHYEGIDQRVLDEIVDEEISIGDYVLTGGEIPACIVVDCVSRMIDGVLASPECYEDESISSGLLEYPQYTRPVEFHGKRIPDVLLSGHHERVARWRYEESVRRTQEKRPDLLKNGIPPYQSKRSETYGTHLQKQDKNDTTKKQG